MTPAATRRLNNTLTATQTRIAHQGPTYHLTQARDLWTAVKNLPNTATTGQITAAVSRANAATAAAGLHHYTIGINLFTH
ncbi:hypothetical protein [Streptomyces cinereoruber]|uniref:hypothetical protein n=1 Tax=Streptomyces cinereoruber TaxID=67260 RepID=UPI0036390243